MRKALMAGFILAIDQGTTNTKALAMDAQEVYRRKLFRADACRLSPARMGRTIGPANLACDDRCGRWLS